MNDLLSISKNYEGVEVEFIFPDEVTRAINSYEIEPNEMIEESDIVFKSEIKDYVEKLEHSGEEIPQKIEIVFSAFKNKGSKKRKGKVIVKEEDSKEVLFSSSISHGGLVVFYKGFRAGMRIDEES